MADLEQAWTRAASAIGGELELVSNTLVHAPHLVAEVGKNRLEAGITTSGNDIITWVSGEAIGAFGLRLLVSASESYPFAESFEFSSGNSEFDACLTTRTNDAPFARLWLDDEVQRAIAVTRDYHFIVADEAVSAWRHGQESDADNLIATLRAVVALGARGDRIRSEWHHLAAHIGGRIDDNTSRWRPDGALSISVTLAGTTAHVAGFFGALGKRRAGRGLFTRVRCERTTRSADQFVISDEAGRQALNPQLAGELQRCEVADDAVNQLYAVVAEAPERTGTRLDADMCERLIAARPEVIIAEEDQVTLFFLGFETDPVRVRAGVEIVAAMALDATAAGLAGPYR